MHLSEAVVQSMACCGSPFTRCEYKGAATSATKECGKSMKSNSYLQILPETLRVGTSTFTAILWPIEASYA